VVLGIDALDLAPFAARIERLRASQAGIRLVDDGREARFDPVDRSDAEACWHQLRSLAKRRRNGA
jgi:hypothetical protein